MLGDHLHILAEADSAQALTKGIQKITISMARLINVDGVRQAGGSVDPRAGSLRNRKGWIGKIFRDRYHAHYLTSEREMSSALTYLFSNAERHFGRNTPVTVSLIDQYGRRVRLVIDLFTSFAELQSGADPPPISRAHGFLLNRAMQNTPWAIRRGS